jgi:cyclophilin family peptidyl-prolyl cis-trans isomerase
VTGLAFVDHSGTGAFLPQDTLLPGIVVNLSGTTNQGKSVNVNAVTDGGGAYTFANVQPGSYQLGYLPTPAWMGGVPSGSSVIAVSRLSMTGGKTVTQNVTFPGLGPAFFSLTLFENTTTESDFPFAAAGGGTGAASSRPNSSPFVKNAIPAVAGITNGSNQVDLAGFFSDPDFTNSLVRFDTSAGPINVQLFDTTAPQTVANFFDYVESGAYTNSFFHRLVPGFVLQGGGFTLQTGATTSINPITTIPAAPSEFGGSNAQFTLATTQDNGNPNTSADEFFFNLANNTGLDPEKFTVFGKLLGSADQAVLNNLAAVTPTTSIPAPFNQIPLINPPSLSGFPGNTTASNYEVIRDVAVIQRTEALTYSVVGNTDKTLVTTTLQDEHLTLKYATGKTGSAIITVKATDEFGASVTTSFTVNVNTPPPVVTGVTIAPDNVTAATKLTANATGKDASGDTVTFKYQWFNGNTAISSISTSPDLDLTGLTVNAGDKITVQVTPFDGTVAGAPFTSNAVTIATGSPTITLDPPAVDTLTITPDSATRTTLLTANPVSNDGTVVSFAYQWFQQAKGASSPTAIGGANGPSLSLTSTPGLTVADGDQFTVQVTPSDVTGAGTAFTSKPVTVTVTNSIFSVSAPKVTLSIAPDNAANVTKLTVTPSSNPSGATFTFQWSQNGTAIPNATAATLDLTTLGSLNLNDFFTVQVTASDGTFSIPVMSNPVIVKGLSPTTVSI